MTDTPLLSHAEQALALARAAGATAADAICVQSRDLSAGIRAGQPETIESAESTGIGLRVFVGEASASLSTSDFNRDALRQLAENAVAIARAAPADPFAALAPRERLATSIPDLDLADRAMPTMAELQQQARDCEEAGRRMPGITNSEGADASASHYAIALATSHGFAGSYAGTRHSLSLSLIAGAGDTMQRDYDYATTTHRDALPEAATLGRLAAERTLARLNPRKLPSQRATVYFEPRVGRSLLGAFASAISGQSIARGTSFLKGDLGKEIFSPAITITDDPLRPRGLGSRPFDGEGVAGERRDFIAHGVLTSWLLDTRSAAQLGLATTGHASRGLSGAPHPATTNLFIQPGTHTPEQLFAQLGDGFYVTETIGHGVNLITGDYSVGASGFWLTGGVRAYPVSEVTIAGNLREMFRAMIPANDLQFRYASNAPTLAVPGMTIAGTQ